MVKLTVMVQNFIECLSVVDFLYYFKLGVLITRPCATKWAEYTDYISDLQYLVTQQGLFCQTVSN